MTITEQDIELTKWEKLVRFLGDTPFAFIVIPVGIIMIGLILVLIPIIIIIGLTYENVFEKYYYKLTGKERKRLPPQHENICSHLSISAKFKYLHSIDGCIDKLMTDLNIDENERENLDELGIIIIEPSIPELADKYFDHRAFIVFKDNLFVQEVKLPNFETSIGYINSQSRSYQIIKNFESYTTISFNKIEDELRIMWREPKVKKQIIVK